eukprot:1211427-Alexandrium_andersonii.AAC.1
MPSETRPWPHCLRWRAGGAALLASALGRLAVLPYERRVLRPAGGSCIQRPNREGDRLASVGRCS